MMEERIRDPVRMQPNTSTTRNLSIRGDIISVNSKVDTNSRLSTSTLTVNTNS